MSRRIAVFGATGSVGRECVAQCLERGDAVTVLARTPEKLASDVRERARVVEGDGLDAGDVGQALEGADAALFAIGIDRTSPEDLCTDATRHILGVMPRLGVRRLVVCGGGSTPVDRDPATFGVWFVRFFASTFMGLRNRDKTHQLALLEAHPEIEWVVLRPLQLRSGPRRESYRMGFDRFSGLSWLSFADCAHAMIAQLDSDAWLRQAPIVQY